ncbi:hypothetical protein CYMTET_37526 [Cymbomonas tetramitiformis]|uniref:thiamine phosphate synthase n=1 Tax=Cymbomonas tetramitiformis TaxID=36881 RepID=A0AAE0F7G7_9CHLO|nr:hypothetical protein CYMTET_37526 [Cymbomonas tetramitiformis]
MPCMLQLTASESTAGKVFSDTRLHRRVPQRAGRPTLLCSNKRSCFRLNRSIMPVRPRCAQDKLSANKRQAVEITSSSTAKGASTTALPMVLTVAGSDSGGGAGIQADLKTMLACGGFGMSVVTSVTAQNSQGVQGVHVVPCEMVAQQLDSVLGDLGVDCLKTGMLPTPETVRTVSQKLRQYGISKVVVDPVLVSTSGCSLAESEVAAVLKAELLPLCTVLTPNLPEAAALLEGRDIRSVPDMEQAAKDLHALGPAAVLVKGGHLSDGAEEVVDVMYDGERVTHFSGPRVCTSNTHGTGCTLSSAIATNLAQGLSPKEAVRRSKAFITELLKRSSQITVGSGPQWPMHHAKMVEPHPGDAAARSPFDAASLRCYAVTDPNCNAKCGRSLRKAVELAIQGGATIVQLREKNIDGVDFVAAARTILEIARPLGIPVLINDRVDVALAAGVDGVHVGQEDIACADVRAMLGPDKIIGVSVKTPEEAVKAMQDGADYLGSGAVYPTSTKADSSVIGLEGLRHVCEAVDIPVVSIGGVNASNVAETIKVGCAGGALVSAIFGVDSPATAAKAVLDAVDKALVERQSDSS